MVVGSVGSEWEEEGVLLVPVLVLAGGVLGWAGLG